MFGASIRTEHGLVCRIRSLSALADKLLMGQHAENK